MDLLQTVPLSVSDVVVEELHDEPFGEMFVVDGVDLILLALVAMASEVLAQISSFSDDLFEVIVNIGGQSAKLGHLVT